MRNVSIHAIVHKMLIADLEIIEEYAHVFQTSLVIPMELHVPLVRLLPISTLWG